jgi:cold shock CspA family protein/ribosome-associated translation inhibitor RaiA
MQIPAEIVFQHCEASAELRAAVEKQVERLERFSQRITSCRVVVSAPATRHRSGDVYEIDIRIAMPGGKDVIVGKPHGGAPEREHPLVAIRLAFDRAVREIEDAMRDLRGDVKRHAPEAHGRIVKLIAGEPYGFIETADGREVYFHRHAVAGDAFDRLAVGAHVRFVEEAGDEGPQASAVWPTGAARQG